MNKLLSTLIVAAFILVSTGCGIFEDPQVKENRLWKERAEASQLAAQKAAADEELITWAKAQAWGSVDPLSGIRVDPGQNREARLAAVAAAYRRALMVPPKELYGPALLNAPAEVYSLVPEPSDKALREQFLNAKKEALIK